MGSEGLWLKNLICTKFRFMDLLETHACREVWIDDVYWGIISPLCESMWGRISGKANTVYKHQSMIRLQMVIFF